MSSSIITPSLGKKPKFTWRHFLTIPKIVNTRQNMDWLKHALQLQGNKNVTNHNALFESCRRPLTCKTIWWQGCGKSCSSLPLLTRLFKVFQNFSCSSILVYHLWKHAMHFCSTWMMSQMHIEKRKGWSYSTVLSVCSFAHLLYIDQ